MSKALEYTGEIDEDAPETPTNKPQEIVTHPEKQKI
jgi:hypothetical protein